MIVGGDVYIQMSLVKLVSPVKIDIVRCVLC